MRTHAVLRRAWRLVPRPIREAAVRLGMVRAVHAVVPPAHDDVYDAAYYDDVDGEAERSAPAMVRSMVRDLAPATLLDVGCGGGAILAECVRQGIAGRGLEYSEAGLARCRSRGLDVARCDLEIDALDAPPTPYDVVLSAEVAEHLPASVADRFVDALASQGRTIVLTAATPGQGGTDHVNEQPHAYWIGKLAARGFTLDDALTMRWRAEWAGATASWYADNVMVFRRAGTPAADRALA